MRHLKTLAAAAALTLASSAGALACEYMDKSVSEAPPVTQTASETTAAPATGASTDVQPAEVATTAPPATKTN